MERLLCIRFLLSYSRRRDDWTPTHLNMTCLIIVIGQDGGDKLIEIFFFILVGIIGFLLYLILILNKELKKDNERLEKILRRLEISDRILDVKDFEVI